MNVNLDAKYELYINGQWVAPSGGKYFTTTNPATGEKLAECAEATQGRCGCCRPGRLGCVPRLAGPGTR